MTKLEIFRIAIGRMAEKPRNLGRELRRASEDEDFDPTVDADDLFSHLENENDNDSISIIFHQKLAAWDYQNEPDWGNNTGRSTNARRQLIYSLLKVTEKQADFCSGRYPYAPALDATVEITNDETGIWKPVHPGKTRLTPVLLGRIF